MKTLQFRLQTEQLQKRKDKNLSYKSSLPSWHDNYQLTSLWLLSVGHHFNMKCSQYQASYRLCSLPKSHELCLKKSWDWKASIWYFLLPFSVLTFVGHIFTFLLIPRGQKLKNEGWDCQIIKFFKEFWVGRQGSKEKPSLWQNPKC